MECNFSKPQAIAIIKGGNVAPNVNGIVKLYQKQDGVLLVADINGLPHSDTGFFGFHIHEGTDCAGGSFSGSKAHYNPDSSPHPKHAGDLPPLMLCGNIARLSVLTDRFNISDVIGRAVVIHDMPDNFTSQPSGNSGNKIACGIIKAL